MKHSKSGINKGEHIKAVPDEGFFQSVITHPDGNTVITRSHVNVKLWDVKNDFIVSKLLNCKIIPIIKIYFYYLIST
jgi:hypothetical protein